MKDANEALRTEYEKGRADVIAEMQIAWSEEDNKWFESLIQTFEDGYLEGFNQLKFYGVISWLKSLKDRYTWKPTTEQLRELRCVISGCSFETSILVELEENLKKLL